MNMQEFLKEIDPDAGWDTPYYTGGIFVGFIRDKHRMCPICHVANKKRKAINPNKLHRFMNVQVKAAAEYLGLPDADATALILAADDRRRIPGIPGSRDFPYDTVVEIRQQLLEATGLKGLI